MKNDDEHASKSGGDERVACCHREECAVCRMPYEDGEVTTRLPDCGHAFHSECLAPWLEDNKECPMCKTEITLAAGDEGARGETERVIDRREYFGRERAERSDPRRPSPPATSFDFRLPFLRTRRPMCDGAGTARHRRLVDVASWLERAQGARGGRHRCLLTLLDDACDAMMTTFCRLRAGTSEMIEMNDSSSLRRIV